MLKETLQALKAALFSLAVAWMLVGRLNAATCPGGVEIWRELKSSGELVIHCKHIEELTADEWRSLSPEAVAALSKQDRAKLDARRKALGIVLVVSPSRNLDPETRDLYERQVAALEAKRQRAQRELDRINRSRETTEQAAIANGQVIRDLTADSISHSLNVMEGLLFVYEGAIPSGSLEKIKAALNAAKVIANGMAFAGSESNSDRQGQKLLETLNAMKNLIPANAVGMADPRE